MQIKIENVRPDLNGVHELDIETRAFTTTEWEWVKRFADYRPLTLQDGLDGGDPSLFCVFALIALVRNGKVDPQHVSRIYRLLADQPFDGEHVTTIEDEGDEAPLAQTNELPSTSDETLSSEYSGPNSTDGSASPASTPIVTGDPG